MWSSAAEAPSEPPLQPDEPIRVPAGSPRVEVEADSDASADESEPLHAQLAPTLALLVGYASVPGHALELTLASEVRYGETLGSWTSPIALTVTRGNERVDAADDVDDAPGAQRLSDERRRRRRDRQRRDLRGRRLEKTRRVPVPTDQ